MAEVSGRLLKRGCHKPGRGFTVGYGKSKDIQFDSAGTHFFICYAYIYEGMVGTITVGGPSTQPGFPVKMGKSCPGICL